MGLAASQARLLTITSRKSRAQFESMRYSHEKLALSRNLTDVSNEYQNSLDQTKLFYDFYGINSTDTPLTYNMLMSPSSINNYTPTLISNNQGQIVLSAPYASAAAAAGVPQEGLGCMPSSLMRDAFIQNLAQAGVITQATADSICIIEYNNRAGLGGDNLINTIKTTGSYNDLLEMLSGVGTDGVTLADIPFAKYSSEQSGNGFPTLLVKNKDDSDYKIIDDAGDYNRGEKESSTKHLANISLADLLKSDASYVITVEGNNDLASNWSDQYMALVDTTKNVYTALGDKLFSLLGGDSNVADAISYANSQMDSELWVEGTPPTNKKTSWATKWLTAGLIGNNYVSEDRNWYVLSKPSGSAREGKEKDAFNDSVTYAEEYMGLINVYRSKKHWSAWAGLGDYQEAVGSLNLSNFTKAWFTYFMQYMEGLGSAKSNTWYINWREKSDKEHQSFANEKSIGDFEFTFSTTRVSDNEALVSNFYDTLFNQICVNGWTENNEVATDSSYLKEMLQNGQMYITSMSDDYYFYQNNYATNTFIKEVTDEAAIAKAESKYKTEKARINAKEQEIDLKMKNLDTEISSLETEYEAVKKVIDGNVSKSFTRYDS